MIVQARIDAVNNELVATKKDARADTARRAASVVAALRRHAFLVAARSAMLRGKVRSTVLIFLK